MKQWDVVVVGAGPAGSSAAIALARQGYSIALLDKAQFPREKLCGDFLNPVNWPVLREFGVDAEIRSRPHETITSVRFTSFSGEEVEIPFRSKNGETAFGFGLRRFDLDDVLVRQAGREGAEFLQACRVKALKRESQGWFLQLERAGATEEISARMLVGADGRNSSVAHRLGMSNDTGVHGRSAGFQVQLESFPGIRNKLEIHLFPGGYAGIVGLNRDTVNLCLAIERDRLADHRPAQSLLCSCLPQNPWLEEILRSEYLTKMRSTYPVYFRARRAYDNRVLLVGDAARVSEPVTGEGIYFAMKSGLFAANTIHQAFVNNDFSISTLSLYARKCRNEFRLRQRFNSVIRWFIYRPALLSPVIRFSGKRPQLLQSIVHAICLPTMVSTENVDKSVDNYDPSLGRTARKADLLELPK